MDSPSGSSGADLGATSCRSHDTPCADISDIDSSDEDDSLHEIDTPARQNILTRKPQYEHTDSSTSSTAPIAGAPLRPTNTRTQHHVTVRNPLPQSFAPIHDSGICPTRAHITSETPRTVSTVTLCVGGRKFLTTRDTLTRASAYFSDLLDDRAKNGKLPDGSYFIDADACLFDDILQYLRRGLLPIYWDRQKGHNHPRYAALLAEAQLFQLDRLTLWLKQKGYLQAVKLHTSAKIYPGPTALSVVDGAEVERLPIHCFRRVEKRQAFDRVYVCPRGIDVHQHPEDCGKACIKARGEAAPQYVDKPAKLENGQPRYVEAPIYDILVVSKTITFDESMCTQKR